MYIFIYQVSFLVHPGKYKVTKDMVIFPDREVDIVGNVKDEEEVLFYCKGIIIIIHSLCILLLNYLLRNSPYNSVL